MQNRRKFIGTLAAAGTASLLSGAVSTARSTTPSLQPASMFPPLKDTLTSPVIIREIGLYRYDSEWMIKVVSAEGAEGISLCNFRVPNHASMFHGLVIPHFIGKDARDIISLVDEVYTVNSNYKYAGMPFWNTVGHAEIALFDLLGKIANKPVNQLLGKPLRQEIDIYLSSTTRATTPEEECDFFEKRMEETGAKAVKFKVGGRMSRNQDAAPGRSQTIVPLMRKRLGDTVTMYVDANGSYDVANGLAMAKFLESHNVDIFEEPVPFDEYENTKHITDQMNTLRIAGGEQDTSLYRFGWMASNKALDVLQPDLYYNGGFVRCLQVVQYAAEAGLSLSPHSPKTDPLAAPMLHLMSVVPNTGGFQEWHVNYPNHKPWYTPHFEVKDGKVKVPASPGLGVSYDPAIWAKAERVSGC